MFYKWLGLHFGVHFLLCFPTIFSFLGCVFLLCVRVVLAFNSCYPFMVCSISVCISFPLSWPFSCFRGFASVIFLLSLLISGLAVHSRGRLSILVCPRVGIYPFYGLFVRVIYFCHTSISIRSICRTFLSRWVVPCGLSVRRFLSSKISLSTSTESDQQFVCRRS